MKVDDLVKTAMEAATAAARQYHVMSGGKTVHEHPIETYISAKIAERLYEAAREKGGYAALEMTFREVEETSGADRRGRPLAALPPTSRFDVVYGVKGRPIGLIEVKKRFSAARLEGDIIRLSHAVRKFGPEFDGSVRFGLAISLQRLYENGRQEAEQVTTKFEKAFDWGIPPKFAYIDESGNFNTTKRGRNVVGVRAYSVLFEADRAG